MTPPLRTFLLCLSATSLCAVSSSLAGNPAVPGIVQAESYSGGGAGVASDPGGAGGFHLASTDAGEYVEFAITATSNFVCRMRYRVASNAAGPFVLRLAMDGVTEDVLIADGTGGWTTWADEHSSRPFEISSGTHTARVSFQTGNLNLDEIEFVAETAPLPLYRDPAQTISNRVEDLLARMSSDEKIGQTVLVDRTFLTVTPANEPFGNHEEADIQTYLLGAIFSGGGSAPTPNTVTDWGDMVDRFQAYAMQTPLGIPILYGTDAVHGHNNLVDATIFPHHIGQGMSADAELVERVAQAAAVEIAASGAHWTLGPTVAVARNEWWGRTYESFSEDPDRVTPLAGAAVRGYQGTDVAAATSVVACAKHYVGDGGTEWGTGTSGQIDQGDVILDESDFRRIHLAPFEEAVSNGVLTIMASYNSWNGQKLHGHTNMLTDVLRGELGFDGIVLSDWRGVEQIYPAGTPGISPGFLYYENIIASVNAGIDMVMIPDYYQQYILRYQFALSESRISSDRLDEAVRRILTVKFKAGVFDRPFTDRTLFPRVGSVAHREIAREAVRKSVVPLKNDGYLLPLSKHLSRIHVAGRQADNLGHQCGGWTITWQGGSGDITTGTTILEAIQATVSPTTVVTYSANGSGAAGADVGIVVVGETPYAEGLGDSQNITLSGASLAAIDAVRNAGVPVAVVLISGRPLIVDPFITDWDACLAAWLPGTEGQGVADVIFGDYNADATLSQTWPNSTNTIPINVGDAAYDPLFAYGFSRPLLPAMALGFGSPMLELRWPADADGYVVQHAPMVDGVYTNVPGTPAVMGTELVLTNSLPTDASGFFRLAR